MPVAALGWGLTTLRVWFIKRRVNRILIDAKSTAVSSIQGRGVETASESGDGGGARRRGGDSVTGGGAEVRRQSRRGSGDSMEMNGSDSGDGSRSSSPSPGARNRNVPRTTSGFFNTTESFFVGTRKGRKFASPANVELSTRFFLQRNPPNLAAVREVYRMGLAEYPDSAWLHFVFASFLLSYAREPGLAMIEVRAASQNRPSVRLEG